MIQLVLVAVGSALGGLARYSVGALMATVTGWPLHWATMLINVSGSLFLGWFLTMLNEVWTIDLAPSIHSHREYWRLLVAVGFTGGYTTFSSFEAEAYGLFSKDDAWTAIFYITGSVFFGLVAFRVGMLLAGGK